MSGWWWRYPVAVIGVYAAFLPPSPLDSSLSFGLADRPVFLALMNAVMVVGSVLILLDGQVSRSGERQEAERHNAE